MTSSFEWMMALRYLRPRRQQGFISVIAIFSLLGIAIGVWALIVVMSVMNGFRDELWARILGLNGHVLVESFDKSRPITNYEALAERIRLISGREIRDSDHRGRGAGAGRTAKCGGRRARHSAQGSRSQPHGREEYRRRQPRRFQGPRCRRHRRPARADARRQGGRPDHAWSRLRAPRPCSAMRRAWSPIMSRRRSISACRNMTRASSSCRSRRPRSISRSRTA